MLYDCADDNILQIRNRHPEGLHFVVGDLHGEVKTLMDLMSKIQFDAEKDHVYFIGDYSSGGNETALLSYLSRYYQADTDIPGFHLIRGNHERELSLSYPLANLPDLYVVRGKNLTFYLAHAGMVSAAFELLVSDIEDHPEQMVFAYKLGDECVEYDAPLRQLIWSRKGLYSQSSRWHVWPSEEQLLVRRALIIHGHTPYCFFCGYGEYTYGARNLFWKKHHIFFSEDLQSFDIDSNIKGRMMYGEQYRGLTCLCMEVFDAIAENAEKGLTVEKICEGVNGVFSVPYSACWNTNVFGDIDRITMAKPEMKIISLDSHGKPYIRTNALKGVLTEGQLEMDLSRFTMAHERAYETALAEIRRGRKESHWMWYIFPQIVGLGRSSTSRHFAIKSAEEARAFLADTYLGRNLQEISTALLSLKTNDVRDVFWPPDDMKLRSSMTLFAYISEDDSVFQKVLDKYFDGIQDWRTLKALKNQDVNRGW